LTQYGAALALAKNDPDLQETVAQLARQLEPPQPSTADEVLAPDDSIADETSSPDQSAADETLLPDPSAANETSSSLDQMESEPLLATPETPQPEEPAELAPAREEPVPSEAELEHTARTLAALEQWLDAIHVARADRRA
jgi:hypothetical protein